MRRALEGVGWTEYGKHACARDMKIGGEMLLRVQSVESFHTAKRCCFPLPPVLTLARARW